MKLYYVPESDSGMLCFTDGPASGGNSEVTDNVYTMHDADGRIIGIEVMGGAAEYFKLADKKFLDNVDLIEASHVNVRYYEETDSAYLCFIDGVVADATREVAPDIHIDIAADGRLIGIEIIAGAKAKLSA